MTESRHGKTRYPVSQVVINPELKKEVQEIAKAQGRTFSSVIEDALATWLNNLR
jgi:predicted transcriptional regulator